MNSKEQKQIGSLNLNNERLISVHSFTTTTKIKLTITPRSWFRSAVPQWRQQWTWIRNAYSLSLIIPESYNYLQYEFRYSCRIVTILIVSLIQILDWILDLLYCLAKDGLSMNAVAVWKGLGEFFVKIHKMQNEWIWIGFPCAWGWSSLSIRERGNVKG